MSTLAFAIASRINALSFAGLPPQTVHWARLAIADNIAVALGGCREPSVDTLLSLTEMSGVRGSCTVLGRAVTLPALEAAFVNGAAAHALDFDDCSPTMDGHPSVPMVPALLALAEELDRSGRDVIEAYVAGYETETAIASVVNPDHGQRGWHPTATLGIFGAAAACAKLLNLDDEAFAVALSIAASSAAGLRANSGTMTKHLHAAQSNRNGLQAALLAQKHFTANPGALEHELGYFNAYGARAVDPQAVLARLDRGFDILKPGIAIKQYPCCAFTHPAIDAMLKLRAREGISCDDIASIKVELAPKRMRNVNRPDPRTDIDAKFSVHYVVAIALKNGGVRLSDFEGNAFLDPNLRELMERINLQPHDGALAEAIVTITGKNGRTCREVALRDMGRGPDDPMSDVEFRDKFLDCAAAAVSGREASSLFDRLMSLENARSIRSVLAAARGHQTDASMPAQATA